jgi:hypothetical protein
MTHLTRKVAYKNPDGSYKTIGQMMKSQMTVLAYGKFLATQMAAKGTN